MFNFIKIYPRRKDMRIEDYPDLPKSKEVQTALNDLIDLVFIDGSGFKHLYIEDNHFHIPKGYPSSAKQIREKTKKLERHLREMRELLCDNDIAEIMTQINLTYDGYFFDFVGLFEELYEWHNIISELATFKQDGGGNRELPRDWERSVYRIGQFWATHVGLPKPYFERDTDEPGKGFTKFCCDVLSEGNPEITSSHCRTLLDTERFRQIMCINRLSDKKVRKPLSFAIFTNIDSV